MENRFLLGLLALVIVSFFFYFNAYVCDDAFITFRVLDNWIRGYGLRWNVLERVQVATSPLFMLLVAPFYALVHDRGVLPNPTRAWALVLVVSYLLSLGTVWAVWRRFRDPLIFFLVLLLLLSSQAFVTFTSSGLETPLSYLLLTAFFTRYLRSENSTCSDRDFLLLSFLAALIALNRLDLILLIAPACLHLAVLKGRAEPGKMLALTAFAVLPLLGWFVFSLVYFGFLLPNTYYAKIGLVADPSALWGMGWKYLRQSYAEDAVTLGVIVLASLSCAFRLRSRQLCAQLGSLAYVVYITKIGGDFLGFRFLAMSFLVSVLVLGAQLAQINLPKKHLWIASLVVACLSVQALTVHSPLRAYLEGPRAADVRYYYYASGLRYYRPGRSFPFAQFHAIRDETYCQSCRADSFQVHVTGGGLRGFCRGPLDHMVDPQRITDPLLARLPNPEVASFVPGHLMQPIPAGYLESIVAGTNLLRDPELASYYDKLRTVVSGDLFTMERFRFIGQLNFPGERRYQKPYQQQDPPYPYDRR
jgi:arabinofuranosyltransferase